MACDGGDNEYERLRTEKIAQNRAKLAQLGLVEASRALLSTARGPGITLEPGTEAQPRKKRRVAKEQAEPVLLEPTRQSSRLRGEAAPSLQQAVVVAQQEAAEEEEVLGRTRKGTARKRLTLDNTTYAAPFTLWSIGVTVWELGRIHRGAWAHRYWSSSGCLFHHAYPVGYRASKVQFGRTYEMTIEEGPTGPVFKVTDPKTGVAFSGPSPTKPWTDVCLAHKTGQRISGPLFFGFSDVATQRAIAALYTPEELQAALQGERVESAQQSAEERAAKEFRGVEGIGEATAMALAFTTQLGGSQHRGLESLRGWVRQSVAHQEQLREYLTSSTELPEATRKWPAWRIRMIPSILAALCSGNTRDGSNGGGRSGDGSAEGEPGPSSASGAPARAGPGWQQQQQQRAQGVLGSRAGARAVADAAAGHAEAEAGSAVDEEAGHSEFELRQHRAALGQRGPRVAAASGGRSKENRPGNSSSRAVAGGKAAAVAAAAAATAVAPARASDRQRKANSKYEQYVVELGD